MLEHDADVDATSATWISFADLMTGLLGAFVLLLVGVMAAQLDMASQLEVEVQKRQIEEQKRLSLENALAIPLASGRITLNNGRIGISGKLLFKLNSDQLEPEGRQLLKSLVLPLRSYLQTRDEMLMVSGFTDDRAVTSRNREFADNWELSAQRALTVTRTLIEEGMPASLLFAAAFGQEQALVPNTSEQARAQNRRVEMAPVPKASNAGPSTQPTPSALAATAAPQAPGTAPRTAP
ncbi:OmpA family protein [Limnohabitans sp.]|uniref:OmpA family protein n=1 Tax=Limnohabitans sp. TaxID=1907725 RepID=UPI0025C16973|nr:OmpA family protein [Limnohabitans sp.]